MKVTQAKCKQPKQNHPGHHSHHGRGVLIHSYLRHGVGVVLDKETKTKFCCGCWMQGLMNEAKMKKDER